MPRNLKWLALLLSGLSLGSVTGCKRYRPAPLHPDQVVAQVAHARAHPDQPRSAAALEKPKSEEATGYNKSTEAQPITFFKAAEWMRKNGPDIREAIAAYQTTLARAKIKTPLPNPGLEVGPQYGFGPDQTSVNPVAAFGSIGFTIPLGKRLRRQDELNRALAEVARIEALVRHREIYLDLREKYTAWHIADRKQKAFGRILKATRDSLDATRKLVDAGQATAVDLALFNLEIAQNEIESLEAGQTKATSQSALARLVGVQADLFGIIPENALPALPMELPKKAALKEKLIQNHAQLARLRARYAAEERSLRLEISKQFPDFQFGPSFDNESGEKRTIIGLTLGIELPFFDRNQQGIAEAEKQRKAARVQYEAAANRALADLDQAWTQLEFARKKTAVLKETVEKKADTNVKLIRRSVAAGAGNILRLLDAERSHRRVQLKLLEAALEERAAWVALEHAIGYPLLRFPGEAKTQNGQPADIPEPQELQRASSTKPSKDSPTAKEKE